KPFRPQRDPSNEAVNPRFERNSGTLPAPMSPGWSAGAEAVRGQPPESGVQIGRGQLEEHRGISDRKRQAEGNGQQHAGFDPRSPRIRLHADYKEKRGKRKDVSLPRKHGHRRYNADQNVAIRRTLTPCEG